MNQKDSLQSLLEQLSGQGVNDKEILTELEKSFFPERQSARVDHDRAKRCGFPEVILGQKKTAQEILEITQTILLKAEIALITRIDKTKADLLLEHYPEAFYDERSNLVRIGEPKIVHPGKLLIVTAGTSDLGPANEAYQCALTFGLDAELICDVGVAGIHRLMRESDKIAKADCLIVAAGMEGALPSVVGGLTAAPLIALPTSVGYGASFGGLAALLAMLNSCASGLSVVNIDNGFGAAYAALRILRKRD